jgi:hypothetical protein
VYRYDGDTLALELAIASPVLQSGANFGRSLSANATQLLVGAPGRNIGGTMNAGGAYLFDADTGALQHTFLNPEPHEFASFGESVALVGSYAVIGTPSYSPSGRPPGFVGAAFVFDVNSGALVAKIVNPSPRPNELFTSGDGTSLTAIGGRLAAGHAFNNGNVGAIYLFSVPEPASLSLLFAAVGNLFAKRLRNPQRGSSSTRANS